MKDQERQALNFEGKYSHFQINLAFAPESESLNITVENTLTRQLYEQAIDEKFISERGNLSCFRDPIQIFDCLVDNFAKVIVEEGLIRFTFVWGKAIKKEKPVSIQLVEKQKDDVKINKLNKQLLQRDARIKELKMRLQQSQEKLFHFQEMMRKNLESKDATIRQLQLRLDVLQNYKKENDEKVQQLIRELIQAQENNKILVQMLDQTPKKDEGQNSEKISHHPENFQQQYYSITNTGTSTKIVRQGEDTKMYYNFVNGIEILPQQKVKYFVRIRHITNRPIILGFCTSTGLGNYNNFQHPESAYYVSTGSFYEGGVKSSSIQQSIVGDGVQCEADLSGGILRWRKNGNIIKECGTPLLMKGKTVYFSVLMYKSGDEIEIFV